MALLNEVFKGIIPQDNYLAILNVRDTDWGDTIRLRGNKNELLICFHTQLEIRVFHREVGIAKILKLENIEDTIDDYFSNVIYEVKDSILKKEFEYRAYMQEGSGQFKHFVIIADNMIVDILSFESNITVHPKKLDGEILTHEIVYHL